MRFLFCFLFLTVTANAAQNVVIVFDDSSSMNTTMQGSRSTRMDIAKTALKQVVSTLNPTTNLGIVLLNGRGDGWIVPFGPLNKETAIQSINQVYPNGRTPLGEAMKKGCDVLLAHRKKEHIGEYRLLVVTDGEANDPHLVNIYLQDILVKGVMVDAIGVDMQANHSLATKVHNYRRGDSQEQLTEAIKATFAESNNQKDSAEDFDIIRSIPDATANALLKSLQNSNLPVGEKEETTASVSLSSPVINHPMLNQPVPAKSVGFLCPVIVGIFLAIAIIVFLKAIC